MAYSMAEDSDTIEVPAEWKSEQDKLKSKLVLHDTNECLQAVGRDDFSLLQNVGGMDISSRKNEKDSCVALVVYNPHTKKELYKDTKIIQLTKPYISGYLAFREVDFMKDLIEKLEINKPDLMPQVIMVDGNGIHHPRGLGLASHLGVLLEIPTIGCAKSYMKLDETDIKAKKDDLKKAGDTFDITDGERVTGKALRSTDDSTNPIYVSQGHNISLETAVKVTRLCCETRIPEPIKLADKLSNNLIDQHLKQQARETR